MKLNVKKLSALVLALVLALSIAACGDSGSNPSNAGSTGGTKSYSIKVEYTADNKDTIPEDMVNQVMFAYSDTLATVETVLTLDPSTMTYTLTKTIYTEQTENDDGELDYTFKGDWEFTGSYTVSDSDENAITLAVPTTAKNYIHYITVLNYQSIEKQTEAWVDSSENPAIATRFNKWYPSKASTVVEQPVTLSGDTMTFGEVDLSSGAEETPAPEETASAENPSDDGPAVDGNAIIGAVADGKVINLYADGTYKFEYATYGIVEEGTWTWAEYVFSGETAGGQTFTAEFNSDYNLAFTYVTDASNAITADFVLENWGDALGVAGTYTPSETAPADDGPTVDGNAIIGAVADGKVINLYADGTFQFAYDKYGIVEEGTWTWAEYVFSGETAGGNTFTAEFNSDYNLAFTYVTDASDAITADFVLENWGDALGAGGTYTAE